MRIFLLLVGFLSFNLLSAQYTSEDVATAVREGNNTLLTEFIASGHDINAPFTKGEHTLLCFAAKVNNPAMVRYLLKKGADINRESNGKTPLMYGAKYGSLESVQALIEIGADPAFKNSKGRTAADYARKYQQGAVTDLLKN